MSANLSIIKRDGSKAEFDKLKIENAILKAMKYGSGVLEEDIAKDIAEEIEKIYLANNTDNKSMLIKVTDKELLEKTGGIIQGMSGAPVIQNGKFIGAVTNVLVNDPTQGYAIFADMMIKQIRSVD